MRCNTKENLAEHSLEVAIISHALATIGNTFFEKKYNADAVAVKAMYHDATEIMTGDLPTPIKYYNSEIRNAYSTIEKSAENKVISLLPPELKGSYEEVFDISPEEKIIIKAADKLCAYIKCVIEEQSGNREFSHAVKSTHSALISMKCPELEYFMKHFLSSFFEPIDNISF